MGDGSRGVLSTELGTHLFSPDWAPWGAQSGPLGSSHKAKTLVLQQNSSQRPAAAQKYAYSTPVRAHTAPVSPKRSHLPHPWGLHGWGRQHRRRLTRRALYRTWPPSILALAPGPPSHLGDPAWPLGQLPQGQNPRFTPRSSAVDGKSVAVCCAVPCGRTERTGRRGYVPPLTGRCD
jgi:hypothetical protein